MSQAHHDNHHEEGGYHATYKGYLIGFVLSVILTAIPFWLVMGKVLPTPQLTAFVILGFAAVQMVVHMVYFLHMNAKVEGGWSMLALIFTVAVVVIMLSGSIWVLYHLNTNMMPSVDPQSCATCRDDPDNPASAPLHSPPRRAFHRGGVGVRGVFGFGRVASQAPGLERRPDRASRSPGACTRRGRASAWGLACAEARNRRIPACEPAWPLPASA